MLDTFPASTSVAAASAILASPCPKCTRASRKPSTSRDVCVSRSSHLSFCLHARISVRLGRLALRIKQYGEQEIFRGGKMMRAHKTEGSEALGTSATSAASVLASITCTAQARELRTYERSEMSLIPTEIACWHGPSTSKQY